MQIWISRDPLGLLAEVWEFMDLVITRDQQAGGVAYGEGCLRRRASLTISFTDSFSIRFSLGLFQSTRTFVQDFPQGQILLAGVVPAGPLWGVTKKNRRSLIQLRDPCLDVIGDGHLPVSVRLDGQHQGDDCGLPRVFGCFDTLVQ